MSDAATPSDNGICPECGREVPPHHPKCSRRYQATDRDRALLQQFVDNNAGLTVLQLIRLLALRIIVLERLIRGGQP